MKRLLAVILFAALTASCGSDNSSTVSYRLDGNGCLIDASDYDIVSEIQTELGMRTVTYIWECADYFNPAAEIDVKESKVTLIFEGAACLTLSASMIGDGYCTKGKTPIL